MRAALRRLRVGTLMALLPLLQGTAAGCSGDDCLPVGETVDSCLNVTCCNPGTYCYTFSRQPSMGDVTPITRSWAECRAPAGSAVGTGGPRGLTDP